MRWIILIMALLEVSACAVVEAGDQTIDISGELQGDIDEQMAREVQKDAEEGVEDSPASE